MNVYKITHISKLVRKSKSSGRHDTFFATLEYPDSGRTQSVFFKVFPNDVSGKLRLNEYLSSLVLNHCGLKAPEVLPAYCPVELLHPFENQMARKLDEICIPGIASVNALPRGVLHFSHKSQLAWEELMGWSGVWRLAGIDELTGNVDRSIEDVVQVGKKFYPFDHDQSFGGELRTFQSVTSALSGPTMRNCIAEEIGRFSDERLRNQMITTARDELAAIDLNSLKQNFGEDADVFFNVPSGLVSRILELMQERQKNLPEYLYAYIALGQFSERSP